MTFKPLLDRIPRMWDWMIVMLVLLLVIYYVAPQMLSVAVFKLALVSIGAVVAPWIDARLFRRKSDHIDGNGSSRTDPYRTVARSIVFLAVVLGLTLGA